MFFFQARKCMAEWKAGEEAKVAVHQKKRDERDAAHVARLSEAQQQAEKRIKAEYSEKQRQWTADRKAHYL